MSTNADIVAAYRNDLLEISVGHAMTALVCYEHFITFKYEMDFLWNRKWSAATWIFVINRYFLVADMVYAAIPISAQICGNARVVNSLQFLLDSTPQVLCIHVFGILRVYAFIQDRFWRLTITWFLIVLAVVELTLQSYVNFTELWGSIIDPVLGSICIQVGFSTKFNIANDLFTTVSIVSIISAAIVLVVTLVKTVRQVRQASLLGIKTILSEILLRDGSMFFILILLEDLFNTVPVLNEWLFGGAAGPIMIPLLTVLPPILLSRFIINLREAGSPSINLTADQYASTLSVPNFRMPTMHEIVGNLGEPLDYGDYQLDDEDSSVSDDDTSEREEDTKDQVLSTTQVGSPDNGRGSMQVDALAINNIQPSNRLSSRNPEVLLA